MARPNMGNIDDKRYKRWQDAAVEEERPWNIWAARTLDKAAQTTNDKVRTARFIKQERAEADRIVEARSIASDTGKP